jgi:hypothetical protein
MSGSRRNTDQADDPVTVAAITLVVREADDQFRKGGGSSRHWVRDCFLPTLNRHGWYVDAHPDAPELVPATGEPDASA